MEVNSDLTSSNVKVNVLLHLLHDSQKRFLIINNFINLLIMGVYDYGDLFICKLWKDMLYLSCWLCLAQCLIWESPENTHTHNTQSPSDAYPHHNSIYIPYQCNFFNSRESVVYTDLGNRSFLFFTVWSHVQQGARQVLLTSLSFHFFGKTKFGLEKSFPIFRRQPSANHPPDVLWPYLHVVTRAQTAAEKKAEGTGAPFNLSSNVVRFWILSKINA